MQLEKVYPIGSKDGVPYRAVLGWSDTAQEHYALIETDKESSDMFWRLPSCRDLSNLDTIVAITGSVVEALMEDNGRFNPSAEDILALQNAPLQRLVDPAEIEVLDMLDTDYAKAPIYGQPAIAPVSRNQLPYEEFLRIIDYGRDTDLFTDDAPIQDLEQTVEDCFAELQTCVSCLESYLDPAQQGNIEADKARLDRQLNGAVVFTACELVRMNEALYRDLSHERLDAIATASNDPEASLTDVFTPTEIELLDAVTTRLCGSKLSDFRKAVEQRGYNPTNGLPLNCPNPETFNWAATIPDSAEEQYRQYGLSEEDAQRAVRIQRADPRHRTEDEWTFLEEAQASLLVITQGQEGNTN